MTHEINEDPHRQSGAVDYKITEPDNGAVAIQQEQLTFLQLTEAGSPGDSLWWPSSLMGLFGEPPASDYSTAQRKLYRQGVLYGIGGSMI
ncbi:uncharacterized protein PGTG_21867 [Puccinia graminis f. sp. tritici CRL 75-36-700-3]|uniref:Uncharacterized protein n=1 Tax=Puccinia graminis f. sp. tritici (strain CRL 75-36-700-3 / race SCCL) TaxID=418459 RepID=H6QST3_PUCGT|nr:uncharacterized protein PGTG_21867 [Puccinia graminis f. sp. tritici CRL 75-36-700-3]EHS63826.1 hypothetical protein PGTG_21867 [Puccinia graminis f. sp. tritici CRL 75-36-700-3]